MKAKNKNTDDKIEINDPDVVRAGMDCPEVPTTERLISKESARMLEVGAGSTTDEVRMGSGWPSFARELHGEDERGALASTREGYPRKPRGKK